MLLPIWANVVIILLTLLSLYLLWRLRKCSCKLGFVEKFEDAKKSPETSDEEKDVAEDGDTKKTEDGDAEDKKEGLTIEEEDKTKEKKVEEKKAEDKKEPKKEAKKASSMADKLLSYGEMQIFEGLKDNAYSLTDIKRMIREGEINEKMIEKFLARIEKMESGGAKPKKDATLEEDAVEGFTGKPNYASAIFA